MSTQRTEIQMLTDFLEGINIAHGALSQLVMSRQNPKYMALRDIIEMVKDRVMAKAIHESV